MSNENFDPFSQETVEINGQKVPLTPELKAILDSTKATKPEESKSITEQIEDSIAALQDAKKNVVVTTINDPNKLVASMEPLPTFEKKEDKTIGEENVVVTHAPKVEEPKKEEPVSETKVNEKPAEEVKKEANPQHTEAAHTNNIANYANLVLGTKEELNEALAADFDQDTRDNKEKTQNPSDYLIAGARALQFGLQNENQSFQQRMLNALIEANKNIGETIKELRLARISAASYLKKSQDSTLSGDLGGLAVIAATQGTYRLILYNSGFNITLRPLTLEMANEFIQEVDRDFEELGRIIGSFYHMPMSVFLKQKVAEFLPKLVVGSNLKNWKERKTLLESISYNDYETILWALCTMLFKDGIGIGMICANKECRDHEINEYVDLTKLCYLNLDKLNGEAVKWLLDTTTQRSAEDIQKYKTEIIGNSRKFTPKDGLVTYVFKDPSLRTYINHGLTLIGNLVDAVNEKSEVIDDDDSEEVKREKENAIRKEKQRQISLHLYKMMIPWIDHLEVKDTHSNTTINVTGYEAIAASLEVRNKYSENLYEQIEDFIRDSRAVFFCVNHLKCPRCGKTLNYNKNDMTALDIEYIFFCLSCLMLEQAGLGVN